MRCGIGRFGSLMHWRLNSIPKCLCGEQGSNQNFAKGEGGLENEKFL